jgi:hypothetical protein
MTKKSADGVQWKRGEDRKLIYFWRLGRNKSKDYLDKTRCAMDYITKYIEMNPKYKELVYDKTWDQIFRMFQIDVN